MQVAKQVSCDTIGDWIIRSSLKNGWKIHTVLENRRTSILLPYYRFIVILTKED